MSKIVITHDNVAYTLEFSRKTVMAMEDSGFELDLGKPNSMVDRLFYGAFQMHHKKIDREKVRNIWSEQRDKEGLLAELVKLYKAPLDDLMAEPEGAEGEENPTPTWKVV